MPEPGAGEAIFDWFIEHGCPARETAVLLALAAMNSPRYLALAMACIAELPEHLRGDVIDGLDGLTVAVTQEFGGLPS